MKKLNKKGQILSELGGLATGIAALAIILTVAFLVMSEGKEQAAEIGGGFCNGAGDGWVFNGSQGCVNVTSWNATNQPVFPANLSHAWNATADLQNATDDIPGWVPLVVIAVIGALLLGLVALFRRR